MSNVNIPGGLLDSDQFVEQMIKEYDSTFMPLPDLEHEPHLLISKVRKHYMEYLIQLLSVNYETNQKLINKNIYLPSAIWRCAKNIEMAAAHACMVVQLYRQNIVAVVKELKNDTKIGKLNRKLYECLHTQPNNEKKLQTTINFNEECTCECRCKLRKKRRKVPESPKNSLPDSSQAKVSSGPEAANVENKIPVIVNSQIELPQINNSTESFFSTDKKLKLNGPFNNNLHKTRMSVESQESDDLMMQLEKLFQGDPNDDDLFDGAFCDTTESFGNDDTSKRSRNEISQTETYGQGSDNIKVQMQNPIQSKSLDERLASLAGLLTNNSENNVTQAKADTTKVRRIGSNKWLCEEYFLKSRLFELLDDIGDTNRKKLLRIKEMLSSLFGEDSDDEGMVSPLEETAEFVNSCKERIAPWVVKLLTPYYIKGRIRGKALFKSLAKHLIRLIYQCSKYPYEHEVHSFVNDFLENHKMIRCEADFKQFRIENI